MNKGIFVTGTDTGVGKTVVAAGILGYLRKKGVDAVPVKPVQTGGVNGEGGLTAPDLDYTLAASGIKPGRDELNLMSPYIYQPACSPHLAARMAQSYPEISVIKDGINKLLESHQAVVVEGAGGVLAPFNETDLMIDLMAALGFPVVLVSRPGLGTINHTLLSLRALQAAGLSLAGVVFNRTETARPDSRYIEDDNPEAIARFGDVQVLGNIRHFTPQELKSAAFRECFVDDMPGLSNVLEAVG
ncbi:MAG: dethiobiotin synthase [Dehalococcoidales bacterium]